MDVSILDRPTPAYVTDEEGTAHQVCSACGSVTFGPYIPVVTGFHSSIEICRRCYALRQVYGLLGAAGGPYSTVLTVDTLERVHNILFNDLWVQNRLGPQDGALLRRTSAWDSPFVPSSVTLLPTSNTSDQATRCFQAASASGAAAPADAAVPAADLSSG